MQLLLCSRIQPLFIIIITLQQLLFNAAEEFEFYVMIESVSASAKNVLRGTLNFTQSSTMFNITHNKCVSTNQQLVYIFLNADVTSEYGLADDCDEFDVVLQVAVNIAENITYLDITQYGAAKIDISLNCPDRHNVILLNTPIAARTVLLQWEAETRTGFGGFDFLFTYYLEGAPTTESWKNTTWNGLFGCQLIPPTTTTTGYGTAESSSTAQLPTTTTEQRTTKKKDQSTTKETDQSTTKETDQPTTKRTDQPTTKRTDQPTTKRTDQPTTTTKQPSSSTTSISEIVVAETIITFTSDFASTVIDTPEPSLFRLYQSQLDNSYQLFGMNRRKRAINSQILLSLVNPNSTPAEFGSMDLTDFNYTTLYGDVMAGSVGIVDGVGMAARMREIRCFTQTGDGSTIYFGDRYVVRKIDRSSGNVTTIFGDPTVNQDNFTSWEAVTFDNINGIAYDNVTNILYVNTNSVGLVAFDLVNEAVSVVVPLTEISSPDVNDYGADLIISADRKWLYMKVSRGINRYNLSDVEDLTTDVFSVVGSRWISSIDTNATHRAQDLIFGSTSFGRLGLSSSGRVLNLVDHGTKNLLFIDTSTGEVNKVCNGTGFSDGNSSVCSFSEIYSSVWIPKGDSSNPAGVLYVFHYYKAGINDENNYVAVATLKDHGTANESSTTTTEQPTTTTQQPATTHTTEQPATEPTTQQPATAPTTRPPATTLTTQQPTTTPTTQQPATTKTTQQPATTQTTQQSATTPTTPQPATTSTPTIQQPETAPITQQTATAPTPITQKPITAPITQQTATAPTPITQKPITAPITQQTATAPITQQTATALITQQTATAPTPITQQPAATSKTKATKSSFPAVRPVVALVLVAILVLVCGVTLAILLATKPAAPSPSKVAYTTSPWPYSYH